MVSSERLIGFSTGALARGDFRRALGMLAKARVPAIELSALREQELPQLSTSLSNLNLRDFAYVSVHAPTSLNDLTESAVLQLLEPAVARQIPVIVHPDAIRSFALWKRLGRLLLIENMDKRKATGRTASELATVFEELPEAGLCFDVAHARQVDPSMTESAQILGTFGSRLREVHASGVTTRSTHGLISTVASAAYSDIAALIPATVPVILESPVEESMIQREIDFARDAFSPWLGRLCTEIDDVLDLKVQALRRSQAKNFLNVLRMTNVRATDFENVIGHLPTGSAFRPGEVFSSAQDLLSMLSEVQKLRLKAHLFARFKEIAREYPDLKTEFGEQFAGVDQG